MRGSHEHTGLGRVAARVVTVPPDAGGGEESGPAQGHGCRCLVTGMSNDSEVPPAKIATATDAAALGLPTTGRRRNEPTPPAAAVGAIGSNGCISSDGKGWGWQRR